MAIRKVDFWFTGVATDALDDGRVLWLNDVLYCSGNKTYTMVTGGSKTVLVLEAFDEKDVLPHLPEKMRESLREQIEAD